MKKHTLLLGAHVSTAKGLENAFKNGAEIGASAIQIFTKSNRQWGAKPLQEEEIIRFKKAAIHSTIKEVIVHAGYLINIGSPTLETYEKSRKSLSLELLRAEQLNIKTLIFHPGSRQKMDGLQCLKQIAATCDELFDQIPGSCSLALETMAGQGTSVAHTLEQIATIISNIKQKKRIKVCVDTCHIFAAGYDIRTHTLYNEFWNQFDNTIGLEYLAAIHLNDSKKELASKADRHEFIGKGKLGIEPFSYIMNDERLFDVPKILETPALAIKDYAQEIQLLKNLIDTKTKTKLHEE